VRSGDAGPASPLSNPRAELTTLLSVVIPTLNEAPRLPRLLQDLTALTVEHQIIIADGGSSDGTVEVAVAQGCSIVSSSPGRGLQLRAGIAQARGDWLLVLHADVHLTLEALREAETAMRRPEVQAAAWPLAIPLEGVWFRLVERAAELRWTLLGLAYGDQGLLLRRTLYDATGGYPDSRIMEDVAIARQIARVARIGRFRHPIVVDPRRWTREGRVRGAIRNSALLLLFLVGVEPDRLARWYQPEPGAR
jgi:rSAM/selenodomain-associated transferase 2